MNDNSLSSIFAKEQVVSDLNKTRDKYNTKIQNGKEMGLEEVT